MDISLFVFGQHALRAPTSHPPWDQSRDSPAEGNGRRVRGIRSVKKKGLFRGCRIPHRGHAPIPGQSLPCMARHMTAIHRALTKGSPHIPCKAYNIHRMGRVGRVIVSVVFACQRPYSTGLTHAIVGSFVFWPIYL